MWNSSTAVSSSSTCQGQRKVGNGCSDLKCCALLFALVLPEVSLGKQHPRAPFHFSWVFWKLVTRMRPQSGFTIPAVPVTGSGCLEWCTCSWFKRAFWSVEIWIAYVLPWSSRPACTLCAHQGRKKAYQDGFRSLSQCWNWVSHFCAYLNLLSHSSFEVYHFLTYTIWLVACMQICLLLCVM